MHIARSWSNGRVGRALFVRGALALVMAILGGLLGAVPAAADYASDYKTCFSFGIPGEQRVAICTRVINSGRLKGRELAGAYNWRGEGFRLWEKYDKALADFGRAIEIEPQSVYPYTNRAEVNRVMGNYDEVIADATQAIRIDPALNASYTVRGLAYEKIGAVEKARGDFNKALDIPKKGNDAGWAQDVARDHLKGLDAK
jgi:tetratricopeptide (TPR) repeat protein